jgi:hypothetical protein
MNTGWSQRPGALALLVWKPFLHSACAGPLKLSDSPQVPIALGCQILYREIEYIRGIFGKELVYAKPVWNLLERQFNVSTRRYKENKGLQYF